MSFLHYVSEGMTFEQTVWYCARYAPDSCGVPDGRVDESARETADRLRERIRELEAMTPADVERVLDENYARQLRYYEESITEDEAKRQKYEAMLDRVRVWIPPSRDHRQLREFMIEELKHAIGDLGRWRKRPTRGSSRTYLRDEIRGAREGLLYWSKKYEASLDAVQRREAYLKMLEASVPRPDAVPACPID